MKLQRLPAPDPVRQPTNPGAASMQPTVRHADVRRSSAGLAPSRGISDRGGASRLQASLSPGQPEKPPINALHLQWILKNLQLDIPPAVIDKQETPALTAIRRELAEAIKVLSHGNSIMPKAADAIRSGDVQHMEALLTLIRHGAIDPNAGVGEDFARLRMALLDAEDPPSPASATSAGSTPPPRMSVHERIARLIDAGFEIDLRTDEGRTLLHNAAEGNSRPEVLQALLDHGIYVNSLCEFKNTALHLAAWESNREDAVSVLLSHDASTSARDKFDRTPLMIAVAAAKPAVIQEIIDKMKARGEDIDAPDPSGSTALHYAVGDVDREEVVAVLLRNGANPLAENKDGDTPRYLHAKRSGQAWPF